MKTERELIEIAEQDIDELAAKQAMEELRIRFDKTYRYCADCDGMVSKIERCCLIDWKEFHNKNSDKDKNIGW